MARAAWQPRARPLPQQEQQQKPQQQQPQSPLQQQPDKPKAFKMPSTELFPSWTSAAWSFGASRPSPLVSRRGARLQGPPSPRERLADSGSPPRSCPRVLTRNGSIHRYIDTASSDTTWDDLVADFVAAFQQQSSLDLLEAEWDAGLAARYKLCYCVLCEIY